MNKVNVHDFLMNNAESMQYALVEYDGKRKAVCYFNNGSKDAMYVKCKDKWSGFLLTLGYKTLDNLDDWEIIYVEEHPPKEVDNIILITERECLSYLIDVEFKESIESLKLRQEIKNKIVEDLRQSNAFDSTTVDKFMSAFDNATAGYFFRRVI